MKFKRTACIESLYTENSETLDIFEPAMHNLFDCGSIITDKMLDGQIL